MKQDNGNHAHTPGPWLDGKPNLTDGPATESGSHIIYSGNREIARVYGDKGLPVKANALLIAAAPVTAQERDRLKALNAELVAALEKLLGRQKHLILENVLSGDSRLFIREWSQDCLSATAVLAKARKED